MATNSAAKGATKTAAKSGSKTTSKTAAKTAKTPTKKAQAPAAPVEELNEEQQIAQMTEQSDANKAAANKELGIPDGFQDVNPHENNPDLNTAISREKAKQFRDSQIAEGKL